MAQLSQSDTDDAEEPDTEQLASDAQASDDVIASSPSSSADADTEAAAATADAKMGPDLVQVRPSDDKLSAVNEVAAAVDEAVTAANAVDPVDSAAAGGSATEPPVEHNKEQAPNSSQPGWPFFVNKRYFKDSCVTK